ncbi:putative RNA triphosphatase [Trypanosoma rangeli]|uniref:mRNA 5'-phosphatase n=1 Tax=Trypanosoma rangeli TaxID=5698 RepID=A0A422P4J1_TRYRA|nr:putative RNA triphosphatase [Trypanosoma rangeli]RNF12649.1 putative RNA triphosphatase [Trypanosoma rangeli]|eukprot:RNF12649.1 putative RNA triphosphatase [Trypanosoma rangeli]
MLHKETKGVSQEEVVSANPADLRTVAKALFACARQHLSKSFIEVELRLCHFTEEEGSAPWGNAGVEEGTESNGLRIVDAKFAASVAAEDYERIKTYLMNKMRESPPTRSVTRDVAVHGWRHTYAIDEDGNPTQCVSCVRKKRLLIKNIVVPLGAYNLRFAVSTETPGRLPPADAVPHVGHTRLKDRLSITDGLFRYDLTRVIENRVQAYEVEIEGEFSSCKTQLTESWLEELLRRAVALTTLATRAEVKPQ